MSPVRVSKIGSEILVNTATAGNQASPRITTIAGGGFVVTWQDDSGGIGGATGDSSEAAVKAQVFAANGTSAGSEILVNTATTHDQYVPDVTALSNGGFVVTWGDYSEGVGGATGDSSYSAVKAQVFRANGTKTGSEVLVNTATAGVQREARITALSNGGFVVTWVDDSLGVGGAEGDSSSAAVKAQVFAANGVKTSSEILVNTATAHDQYDPYVTALSNGGFVVTWTDYSGGIGGATGDSSDAAVKAQVFRANGAKTGSEILVNTATAGVQGAPQVTALSNGGFVVSWYDASGGLGGATGDASDYAVKAQVFAADGTKIGSEILVNTATAGGQYLAAITALPNGGFVATWEDSSGGLGGATGDDSASAVKAQAFAADGRRIGSEILVNTATSAYQLSSEVTALPNGSFVVTWQDNSGGIGGATGDDSGYAVKAQVFGVSSWARRDFDGDGRAELLLRNTSGDVVTGETQNGALAYARVGALGSEWFVRGDGDFFGDGSADVLIENKAGAVVVGDIQNGQAQYTQVAALGSEWTFVGTGDFLGVGHDAFLIENTAGAIVVGDIQNGQAQYTQVAALGSEWTFVGTGDFLGLGHDAFLIENKAGAIVVGDVQNGQAHYTQVGALGSEWTFVETGDFLGLGHDAFLIENEAGAVVVGDVKNGQVQYTQVGALGLEWSFIGAGDYLGTGNAGFVIENKAGEVFLGTVANGQASYAQVGALGSEWQ